MKEIEIAIHVLSWKWRTSWTHIHKMHFPAGYIWMKKTPRNTVRTNNGVFIIKIAYLSAFHFLFRHSPIVCPDWVWCLSKTEHIIPLNHKNLISALFLWILTDIVSLIGNNKKKSSHFLGKPLVLVAFFSRNLSGLWKDTVPSIGNNKIKSTLFPKKNPVVFGRHLCSEKYLVCLLF